MQQIISITSNFRGRGDPTQPRENATAGEITGRLRGKEYYNYGSWHRSATRLFSIKNVSVINRADARFGFGVRSEEREKAIGSVYLKRRARVSVTYRLQLRRKPIGS